MPISQHPTLNVLDDRAGRYLIHFGVLFNEGLPIVGAVDTRSMPTIPNMFSNVPGYLYTIDLNQLKMPIRGNLPAFKALNFCFDSRAYYELALYTTEIFIWNPLTQQIASFMVEPAGGCNGIIPFYTEANQTIQIFRVIGSNDPGHQITSSFSLLSFDTSFYYNNVSWSAKISPPVVTPVPPDGSADNPFNAIILNNPVNVFVTDPAEPVPPVNVPPITPPAPIPPVSENWPPIVPLPPTVPEERPGTGN